MSSFLASGIFSTRSDGTIVCPLMLELVLYDIHVCLLVSFYNLICPFVLFFYVALRTVIIFTTLWSLSETIHLQSPLGSPVTEFLHFLLALYEKRTGATQTGHDISPACWHLSSNSGSGAMHSEFPFCVRKIKIIEDDVGTKPFCGRFSI